MIPMSVLKLYTHIIPYICSLQGAEHWVGSIHSRRIIPQEMPVFISRETTCWLKRHEAEKMCLKSHANIPGLIPLMDCKAPQDIEDKSPLEFLPFWRMTGGG